MRFIYANIRVYANIHSIYINIRHIRVPLKKRTKSVKERYLTPAAGSALAGTPHGGSSAAMPTTKAYQTTRRSDLHKEIRDP